MIYLLLQMFVYLVVAAAMGGAAGWLWRNLAAQKTDEDARRQVNESKGKLPQLESLLRSRDDQLSKLKNQLTEFKKQAKTESRQHSELQQQLRKQDQEIRKLKSNPLATNPADDFLLEEASPAAQNSTNDQELQEKYLAVVAELEALQMQRKGREQEFNQLQRGLVGKVEELTMQLTRANQELTLEKDKVGELEREQELHSKSLLVLHQQLEMERNRHAKSA